MIKQSLDWLTALMSRPYRYSSSLAKNVLIRGDHWIHTMMNLQGDWHVTLTRWHYELISLMKISCDQHSIMFYCCITYTALWVHRRKGNIKKLSLCYSIVYYYNCAQKYEQFLQVGRLYRASVLLVLAPCLPTASVSSVFMVLYIY